MACYHSNCTVTKSTVTARSGVVPQYLMSVCSEVIFVCVRYILDLNKEQEAGFEKKVAGLALEAGFEPWHEGGSGDVHSVFVQQKK